MLGVRDLTYRLAFLACSVVPTEAKVSLTPLQNSVINVCILLLSHRNLST